MAESRRVQVEGDGEIVRLFRQQTEQHDRKPVNAVDGHAVLFRQRRRRVKRAVD